MANTRIPLSQARTIEIEAPGYNVPSLHVYEEEDVDGGQLHCEWILQGFRIGITIPKEGSRFWTIVGPPHLMASGELDTNAPESRENTE